MFTQQKSVVFLEDNSNTFHSIFAFAQLLYSLNNSQSLAYINLSIQHHEHISLLEQLFLRTQLKKNYSYIHIDYYLRQSLHLQNAQKIITRGILAQSEFQNLHIKHLKEMILKHSYQIVVIDNLNVNTPYLNEINELIKQHSSIQFILIGSSDMKKQFLDEITQNHFITFLNQNNNFNNKESKQRVFSYALKDISKIHTILAPEIFSSWLIIAYNFYILKYSFTKRFFFLSSPQKYAKEIAFISYLKRNLKELSEFGDWDFISTHHSINSYALQDISSFESLLSQSLKLKGISNIIIEKESTLITKTIFKFIQQLTSQKSNSLILTNNSFKELSKEIVIENIISIS